MQHWYIITSKQFPIVASRDLLLNDMLLYKSYYLLSSKICDKKKKMFASFCILVYTFVYSFIISNRVKNIILTDFVLETVW